MRKIFLSVPLTAAVALASASAAQAGPVTFWGCHGPQGQPLGETGITKSPVFGGLVDAGGCSGVGDSLRLRFSTATPSNGSAASVRINSPGGVTLTNLIAQRALSGFGTAGSPGSYRLVSGLSPAIEQVFTSQANSPLTEVSGPLSGGATDGQAELRCDNSPCSTGSAAVDVRALALVGSDTNVPNGALGGLTEPGRGAMNLTVSASDQGVGLLRTDLSVDGSPRASVNLAGNDCGDIGPSRPGYDLPVGAACPKNASGVLAFDSTTVSNGVHRFLVTVTDISGNVSTVIDRDVRIDNSPPPRGSTSLAVTVGGGLQEGVGGEALPLTAAPGRCLVPRLSMVLSQRPFSRTRKGTPVFEGNHRYRFRGKLTCRNKGKRVNAPRGTAIEVVNRIGGRVVSKSGATVRTFGELTWFNPSNYTTRTIQFRYHPNRGSDAVVTVRIIVLR